MYVDKDRQTNNISEVRKMMTELNERELEIVNGGVSWQFFGEEPVKSEVETSKPYIFSDNKTNNFVPI